MAIKCRILPMCVLSIYGLLSVNAVIGAVVNSTGITNSTTNNGTTPAVINDGGNDDGSPSTGMTVFYVFLGIFGGVFVLVFMCFCCTLLCKQCGHCEDTEVNMTCECCGATVWQKSY
ncbi:uncharacterized protein LOC125661149 isoform X2 [Ostrea edulis]|uniref:uncharacterized protein LOC125661149 isoform X2 n=1 Tax=Ostrea edulis TaxID=37623 RepID=UPI0024AF34AF|nr:uncharacterized protein LOC125661149 isoform X2 [Ostrea edulis]